MAKISKILDIPIVVILIENSFDKIIFFLTPCPLSLWLSQVRLGQNVNKGAPQVQNTLGICPAGVWHEETGGGGRNRRVKKNGESSLFGRVKKMMANFIPCMVLTVITPRPTVITPTPGCITAIPALNTRNYFYFIQILYFAGKILFTFGFFCI